MQTENEIKKEKKKAWAILIRPEKLEKYKKIAQFENRSFNNFLENSIDSYIKKNYENELINKS